MLFPVCVPQIPKTGPPTVSVTPATALDPPKRYPSSVHTSIRDNVSKCEVTGIHFHQQGSYSSISIQAREGPSNPRIPLGGCFPVLLMVRITVYWDLQWETDGHTQRTAWGVQARMKDTCERWRSSCAKHKRDVSTKKKMQEVAPDRMGSTPEDEGMFGDAQWTPETAGCTNTTNAVCSYTCIPMPKFNLKS